MLWVYFTLLAIFTWSIVNVIDKHIITEHIRQPRIAIVFLATMGFAAALMVPLAMPVVVPSLLILSLSLVAGILYVVSNLFYFKALFVEEVSRVLPLYSITPIFVLILSTIFLAEVFTPVKYIGIVLIIAGSVLISLKKGTKTTLSKALLFVLMASLILSVYYVALKYVTDAIPFWDAFFWTRIGSGLTIPFLIGAFYKPLKETLKRTPKGSAYLCMNESLNVLGVLFFVIATSFGFISLVSSLSQAQPLFVLFIASLVSFYRPKILSEELKRSVITLKIVAIVMIILGALLIV